MKIDVLPRTDMHYSVLFYLILFCFTFIKYVIIILSPTFFFPELVRSPNIMEVNVLFNHF